MRQLYFVKCFWILFGQRLSYSAEEPLADAAKLYWHFFRTEQSGTAGIIITLFLYGVHCILSFTFLYVYFLRYSTLKAIKQTQNKKKFVKLFWSCPSGSTLCKECLFHFSRALMPLHIVLLNCEHSLLKQPWFCKLLSPIISSKGISENCPIAKSKYKL